MTDVASVQFSMSLSVTHLTVVGFLFLYFYVYNCSSVEMGTFYDIRWQPP